MEFLLATAYAAVFIWILRRSPFFRPAELPSAWLMIAFLLKVGAGVFLGWMYYHHYKDKYTSDTIKFFDDSGLLFNTLRKHPYDFIRMFTGIGGDEPSLRHYYVEMQAWLNKDVLFNDNKTIIRLNTFFRFFSCGYYYVHVVFINMISFTGLYCLYLALRTELVGKHRILFVLIFGTPSLLLWGSGLLKDGLMLFALGLLLYSFTRCLEGFNLKRHLLLLAFSLYLLLFTKFYVILTVAPGLTAWWLARRRKGLKAGLIFVAVYGVLLTAGFNLYRINERYDLTDLIYWKQRNFINQVKSLQPGSAIELPPFEDSFRGIITAAPSALVRAVMRPSLFDHPDNILVVMTALENMLLLGLILLLLISCRLRPMPEASPLFYFSLFMTIIILTLVGLITPVLGAMVRYKIVVIPFLWFMVLRLVDAKKIRVWHKLLKDPS